MTISGSIDRLLRSCSAHPAEIQLPTAFVFGAASGAAKSIFATLSLVQLLLKRLDAPNRRAHRKI